MPRRPGRTVCSHCSAVNGTSVPTATDVRVDAGRRGGSRRRACSGRSPDSSAGLRGVEIRWAAHDHRAPLDPSADNRRSDAGAVDTARRPGTPAATCSSSRCNRARSAPRSGATESAVSCTAATSSSTRGSGAWRMSLSVAPSISMPRTRLARADAAAPVRSACRCAGRRPARVRAPSGRGTRCA